MNDKLHITLDASSKIVSKIQEIADPVVKENVLLRAALKTSDELVEFHRQRNDAQDRIIAAHKATIEAQARALTEAEHKTLSASTIDELLAEIIVRTRRS